jgi:hypothetical protein
MALQTIKQIEEANRAIGQHWFSRESMRFFNTKIESPVFFTDRVSYFVSSEQDPEGVAWFGNRRFTIRIVHPDGNVDTWGDFGQFFNVEEARIAILDLIRAS